MSASITYLDLLRGNRQPMQANKSVRLALVVREGFSRELHSVRGLGCRVDEDASGGVNNSEIDTEVAPGDMDERELFMNRGNVERSLVSQDPPAVHGIALEGAQVDTPAIPGD